MASRFNTLYLGDPDEAADELENGVEHEDLSDSLRVALINALHRIAQLEKEVRILKLG